MPAPLGKAPTKKMPNIQVFGMDDSSATRNTLRFFRERRIVVHYVDLRKKPIARGELLDFRVHRGRFIDFVLQIESLREQKERARVVRHQLDGAARRIDAGVVTAIAQMQLAEAAEGKPVSGIELQDAREALDGEVRLPAVGESRGIHFPPIAKHTRADGSRVWTVEQRGLPVVCLSVLYPIGSAGDPRVLGT